MVVVASRGAIRASRGIPISSHALPWSRPPCVPSRAFLASTHRIVITRTSNSTIVLRYTGPSHSHTILDTPLSRFLLVRGWSIIDSLSGSNVNMPFTTVRVGFFFPSSILLLNQMHLTPHRRYDLAVPIPGFDKASTGSCGCTIRLVDNSLEAHFTLSYS